MLPSRRGQLKLTLQIHANAVITVRIFAFLRDTLKDSTIIIEEGDVLEWDNEFYEIDSVGASQYWRGMNPDTDIGFTERLREEYGS